MGAVEGGGGGGDPGGTIKEELKKGMAGVG